MHDIIDMAKCFVVFRLFTVQVVAKLPLDLLSHVMRNLTDYRLSLVVAAIWSYYLPNIVRIVQLMLDFEPRHDSLLGRHIEGVER